MKKIFLILASLVFVMCNQIGDLSDTSNNGVEISKTISGFAQKGPFSSGSQVTIFGLDEKMQPNGKSWPANINDATGAFAVAVNGETAYVDIRVTGYYYNEITGKISDGQITLEAISDLTSEKVNVNILTHLVRPRIKKLIQEGMLFTEARSAAEAELVKALGYSEQSVSFDQLDITKSREGDALLLALACKLQKGKQTGEMLTLINEMSLEFAEEGKLSENTLAELETEFVGDDIMRICENMNEFYQQNNMPDAVIPDFYRYVPMEDIILLNFPTLSYQGTESQFEVYSNIDFIVESDVNWIEVSKEHIGGILHKIHIKVHENTTLDDLKGKILIKDLQGNIMDESVISIMGKYTILRFDRGYEDHITYYEEFRAYWKTFGNEMIAVNGENYQILSNTAAKVRLSESYIAIYPAGKSQKVDENTFIVNFSPVCNGLYNPVLIGVASDINTQLGTCDLYQMDAYFKLDLSNYPDWEDIEIISNCGTAICGDCLISSQSGEIIGVENGKSSVLVNRSNDTESVVYCHILPCTLEGITLKINCEDGSSYSLPIKKQISASRGEPLNLGLAPRPTYPVESISLNVTKLEMNKNSQMTLIATISPENATNKKVTWNSSNSEVASVVDGVVTTHKAGQAKITVTTEDGGKVASCEIVVIEE